MMADGVVCGQIMHDAVTGSAYGLWAKPVAASKLDEVVKAAIVRNDVRAKERLENFTTSDTLEGDHEDADG